MAERPGRQRRAQLIARALGRSPTIAQTAVDGPKRRDTPDVEAGSHEIALSELIGALSRALDVAEGEPPGHATRSCLIGMRLAEALDLDADARSDLFYALRRIK